MDEFAYFYVRIGDDRKLRFGLMIEGILSFIYGAKSLI